MGAALTSLAIGLALAWAETIYDWDWFSRRRSRHSRTDLYWRLPVLVILTAALAWGSWRFFGF